MATEKHKDDEWPVIFSYTRAQAIEDSVLVDLTAPDSMAEMLCRGAGFKLPIAMTTTAFHETVLAGATKDDAGIFTFPEGQSAKGRLWDVLNTMRAAIKANPGASETHFTVNVDKYGDGQSERRAVTLWCKIGAGDTLDPVLTILLEGED